MAYIILYYIMYLCYKPEEKPHRTVLSETADPRCNLPFVVRIKTTSFCGFFYFNFFLIYFFFWIAFPVQLHRDYHEHKLKSTEALVWLLNNNEMKCDKQSDHSNYNQK